MNDNKEEQKPPRLMFPKPTRKRLGNGWHGTNLCQNPNEPTQTELIRNPQHYKKSPGR